MDYLDTQMVRDPSKSIERRAAIYERRRDRTPCMGREATADAHLAPSLTTPLAHQTLAPTMAFVAHHASSCVLCDLVLLLLRHALRTLRIGLQLLALEREHLLLGPERR